MTVRETNNYFRVRLFRLPSNKEDEVTYLSMNHGASGLSEALAYSQPDLTYDPDILPRRNHDLDVYFASPPPTEFFEQLQQLVPQLQWEILEEQQKDWLAEWKKGFVPFRLAGPYWVVPSWRPSPVSPEHSITIDPGMAFGTGTHATTKMASYFVHKICSELPEPELHRLLDVGTGTAILAMLAKKLRVGEVTGIEIDPEARRVARENLRLNLLQSVEIPDLLLEEIRQSYDIVVANIIDGVLVQIKEDLLRVLESQGQLFLTGILLEREETFLTQFLEDPRLQIRRRIEEDEWVGYWVQKN